MSAPMRPSQTTKSVEVSGSEPAAAAGFGGGRGMADLRHAIW
jgi:hypothetical protein